MPLNHKTETHHFIQHLQVQKLYSAHTITSYSKDLQDFVDFLETELGGITVEDTRPPHFRHFIASLKSNSLSARSINRKLSTLKSYYKYLLKNERVDSNPLRAIISPKTSKRLPVFVQASETAKMLPADHFNNTLESATSQLILNLLYQAGLRQAELINIKPSDVDHSKLTLKVTGKGNKERIIPISTSLANMILKYEAIKAANEVSACAELLVTGRGKKLYGKFVYNVVTGSLSAVTKLSRKSPHVLRHSFATHLANGGADINAVKELLGHSSLAATQVYLHNNIQQLKDVYKKAHPKA